MAIEFRFYVFNKMKCTVPATGFYEWQGEKGSKTLLPFSLPNRPIFGFPGIWDEWTMPDGMVRRSCAIITCDPNCDMRPYHDRMPVILDDQDYEFWLSSDSKPRDLQLLLLPLSDGEIVADPAAAFVPKR